MNVRNHQYLGLVVAIGVCLAAAIPGAALSGPGDWYQALAKPAWTPPSWLFGPVWTALYLAMGVSAWLVWRQTGLRGGARPLGLFALQLALNALWTPLFFGLRSPGLALIDIVLLWLAIVATMAAFWRYSRLATALLVPYLLWVSYAAFLNAAIWMMNRP